MATAQDVPERLRSQALRALASPFGLDDATKLHVLGSDGEHVDLQVAESAVRGSTAAWRVLGTFRLRVTVESLEATGA